MQSTCLCAFLLISTGLCAQSYLVAPPYCDTAEGSANNTIPFWGTSGFMRYQQVIGELRGVPRFLTEIAWRRDASFGSTARTIDMELSVADADYATFGVTFASNYVNPPVNVVLRKNVNLPDTLTPLVGLPAPWAFAVPFDTPWLYLGVKDFLYEVTCHAFSTTASYPLDAVNGAQPTLTAGFRTVDTGCTTPSGVMTLRPNHLLNSAAGSLALSWVVSQGPTAAASGVLVGFVDPNLVIPGFCAKLHTDGSFFSIAGTTSATGSWTTPAITVAPYLASYAGLTLTAQAAAVDQTQPNVPIAISNGAISIMPALATSNNMTRLYATTSATIGFADRRYGLVTRFKY